LTADRTKVSIVFVFIYTGPGAGSSSAPTLVRCGDSFQIMSVRATDLQSTVPTSSEYGSNIGRLLGMSSASYSGVNTFGWSGNDLNQKTAADFHQFFAIPSIFAMLPNLYQTLAYQNVNAGGYQQVVQDQCSYTLADPSAYASNSVNTDVVSQSTGYAFLANATFPKPAPNLPPTTVQTRLFMTCTNGQAPVDNPIQDNSNPNKPISIQYQILGVQLGYNRWIPTMTESQTLFYLYQSNGL
jgi:hypothetical protein